MEWIFPEYDVKGTGQVIKIWDKCGLTEAEWWSLEERDRLEKILALMGK